jgi:hypothetical protein
MLDALVLRREEGEAVSRTDFALLMALFNLLFHVKADIDPAPYIEPIVQVCTAFLRV